jgi:hypothetical protein
MLRICRKPDFEESRREKHFFMKKIFGITLFNLLFFVIVLNAQVSVETFPANPQSGSHNYFGVRVTLAQTYSENVTVTGFIYDEGNGPNTNHPFSLTVPTGDLTVETASNFYQTDPTATATADLGTFGMAYAGVVITYEINGCILKFNSAVDLLAVINQLDADNVAYNDDYDSQYPNLTDDQIDEIDEQNGFDEFKKFRDFETLFGGFCSKRAEIENVENTWLANNFTGTNPDDVDLTFDDAENTIFNNSYSVKIGNDVYQYTSSGWYINGVFQGDGGNSGVIIKSNEMMYVNKSFNNWGVNAGPMTFVGDEKYFISLSECKTNKKLSTPPLALTGTNRRVVVKVAIHSIGISSSIKSKVVHFKQKNGNWKRRKTDLAVRVDAIVRNTICSDPENKFNNDPFTVGTFNKRKSLRARTAVIGTIWKAFQGDVVGTFWTKDGYTDYFALTW